MYLKSVSYLFPSPHLDTRFHPWTSSPEVYPWLPPGFLVLSSSVVIPSRRKRPARTDRRAECDAEALGGHGLRQRRDREVDLRADGRLARSRGGRPRQADSYRPPPRFPRAAYNKVFAALM